jgi:hypothetical protein
MKSRVLLFLALNILSLQVIAGQGQSTLAGAAAGAVVGTAGGPPGAVIGAIVGGLGGAATRLYAGAQNYGNWCGEHNTNGGAPIDSLDLACKNHDLCLSNPHNNRVTCHNYLIAAAQRLRTARGLSMGARQYANLICSYAWLLRQA